MKHACIIITCTLYEKLGSIGALNKRAFPVYSYTVN